jgi:hypothetical protein
LLKIGLFFDYFTVLKTVFTQPIEIFPDGGLFPGTTELLGQLRLIQQSL